MIRPRLRSRPTPDFARRWLAEDNPVLAELLHLTVGEGWGGDPLPLGRLETLAFDPAFRGAFRAARRANRERLGGHLREAAGIEVSPDSLVDVRLGALSPHERPLLSVLGLVREHLRLTSGGWTPPAPRTVVLARTAEAAGPGGERFVRLLRSVADAINRDEKARPALRVAVLPACDDEAGSLLAARADLSSQSAAWIYLNNGAVLPIIAAPSVIGMKLGAKIGARLLTVLKASIIRRLVIVMLLFAGGRSLMVGLGIGG